MGTLCTHHHFFCQELDHNYAHPLYTTVIQEPDPINGKQIWQKCNMHFSWFHNIKDGWKRIRESAYELKKARNQKNPWPALREGEVQTLTHGPPLTTYQHNPYGTHAYKEVFWWHPLPHIPQGKYSTWNEPWENVRFKLIFPEPHMSSIFPPKERMLILKRNGPLRLLDVCLNSLQTATWSLVGQACTNNTHLLMDSISVNIK